jgi:hypothetical protein
MPTAEHELKPCPVCGESGRLYAYGEQVANTGPHGVAWVLSQSLCGACLKVVVEAAQAGGLPDPETGG